VGDAFAPWHIVILVVVLVVLFGANRLPGAAQSLGQSMHIFKRSVQGPSPDDSDGASSISAGNPLAGTPATPAPPHDTTQQQLAELTRRVHDLRQQSAGSMQPSEVNTTQPL
jgi:sec-independent protein translocase protein TatA